MKTRLNAVFICWHTLWY